MKIKLMLPIHRHFNLKNLNSTFRRSLIKFIVSNKFNRGLSQSLSPTKALFVYFRGLNTFITLLTCVEIHAYLNPVWVDYVSPPNVLVCTDLTV